MNQPVIVTGLHSGSNPSPGVGIARSLRAAGHDRVIGLDYSPRSSGVHSSVFTDTVIMPSWSEIDVEVWAAQLTELMEVENALLVSNLDAEARLIATTFASDPRILSPGPHALTYAVKPPRALAEAMGMTVAPSLGSGAPAGKVARFIAESPYGVWVKGQHYEAIRARHHLEAEQAAAAVDALWGPPSHLERHVEGQEVSLAFAAVDGVLIDAVAMRKIALTGDGKTWTGAIEDPSSDELDRLRSWVAASGWTGGAELEMVESWSGARTLIELNPRFPAWIHGATICGVNLPAALVLGRMCRSASNSTGFTRIVEEIPLRPELGTPTFAWSVNASNAAATKHPSGMPSISRRKLVGTTPRSAPPGNAEDVARYSREDTPPMPGSAVPSTPWRHLDTTSMVQRATELVDGLAAHRVDVAYSVKTNPDATILDCARTAGLKFEVISQQELRTARRLGVEPADIVCNGPAKVLPTVEGLNGCVVFADSVEELRHLNDNISTFRPSLLGIRLRTDQASRFGIDVTSPDLADAVELLTAMTASLGVPWGVHFHRAQSVLGSVGWAVGAAAAAETAAAVTATIGAPPALVDFGGGWAPATPTSEVLEHTTAAVTHFRAGTEGSSTTRYLVEPGKFLVERTGTLYVRVIFAPTRSGDVTVDGGAPEAPEAQHWPHPVHVWRAGRWRRLPVGNGRLLGRTCMESDVLVRRVDTSELTGGDLLAISDVGAYDASMSYRFAEGLEGTAHADCG